MTTSPTFPPTPELKHLTYAPQLKRIRKLLEKNISHFPYGKCDLAAHLIHNIIGLDVAVGFHLPRPELIESDPICQYHLWNIDKKAGLYIDITRDQFNNTQFNYPKISVHPSTTNHYIPFPGIESVILQPHTLTFSEIQRVIELYHQQEGIQKK